MLASKLICRNACRWPVPKTFITSFSVGLPRTVCSFGNDFIALEMKESLLTFHDDNFCKFYVLYVHMQKWPIRVKDQREICGWTRKKRKPKFKPRPHCLGKNLNFDIGNFNNAEHALKIIYSKLWELPISKCY